jgi:hypothetical protein
MKKTIILILFNFLFLNLTSQVSGNYKNLSLEKLYVHQNATMLFVGEYLFYKVYCLEANTNKASESSKIAYVLLIDKNKNIVSKQKIELKNSFGQGEFFIPATLKSGNYKLIAYTQWMQNNNDVNYYESNLNIINPYLGNQGDVVKNIKIANEKKADNSLIDKDKNFTDHRKFKLSTNKEYYSKREKVEVQLLNTKDKYGFGNYSVSVKKLESYNQLKNYSAREFYSDNFNKKITKKKYSKEHIPEIGGTLISGNVSIKNSNGIASNILVTVSIPGEELFMEIVLTDKNGDFLFFINEYFDGNKAIIQVVNKNRDDYLVAINKPKIIDLDKATFSPFKLTPDMEDDILRRSIHNQIENSYFSVKPDSIVESFQKKYFYNQEFSLVYKLEDYKKFDNINEVFIEVVDPVFKENIDSEIYFHIKFREDNFDEDLIPLVLMDGIMIQDYESLLKFNANKVDRIIVLKKRVHFRNKSYAGVIAIETINKDFEGDFNSSIVTKIDIEKPLAIKQYFNQNYEGLNKENLNRIPDYRNQLFWLPRLELKSSVSNFSFFTSDVVGFFEINLEGFTNIGEAISLKKIIEVKN